MARGNPNELRRQIPVGAADAEGGRSPETQDDRASKEAAQLGSGAPIKDLERDASENEHRRTQQFRDHFECLSIIMLDVLFAGFILLAAVWVLHMILPESSMATGWVSYVHGWLTDGQLDRITGLLAGGVIAGLVADHFKRRMGG